MTLAAPSLARILAASVVLWTLSTTGCSSSTPAKGSQLCPPNARTTLLTATLSRLAPSDAFVVKAPVTVWVATTEPPDTSGLFGGLTAIAQISVVADGTDPRIVTDTQGFRRSADPTVSLDKVNHYVRLPIGAGSWRIYTATLGVTALPVVVVGCPT